MTKEDCDIAGTLGIRIIRTNAESQNPARYRILALSKEYPEQYERERGKKAVNTVTLVDDLHRSTRTRMDMIAPADPVEFEALKAAYLAKGTEGKTQEAKTNKRTVFRRPTRNEVAAYCLAELYEIDIDAFMDHYEACGWVVGKNKPMKDWKAAVRQWARRDKSEHTKPENGGSSSFDTDTFFGAAVERSYREE